jgi:hypothetical protein
MADMPMDAGAWLPPKVSPRLSPSVIAAFLLLLHVGWVVSMSASNTPTVDFFTFWSVSHTLSRAPVANVYSPDNQRKIASVLVAEAQSSETSDLQRQATADVVHLYGGRIDVTGTPLLYMAIGGLSSGNFQTDQKRFEFVCASCLVLSMLILKHLLRFSIVTIVLLTIFVASDYAPVLSDMRVGNVNEIQLFAVMLFIFFTARSRPLLAGLTIGMVTMFKPTTASVLVLSVIADFADRDYRQLLRMLSGCLIAAVATFLASAAYFRNSAIWVDFLHSLPKTLNGVSYPLESGNFSLSALVFGPSSGSAAIILLLLLAAFSWLMFATRRNNTGEAQGEISKDIYGPRRMHTAFAVGGGGCAVMLLSSPLVWLHYYLLLLPLSLYVIQPAGGEKDAPSHGDIQMSSTKTTLLPFVLLSVFSYVTQTIVGNDVRIWCLLIVVATVWILVLASRRIWQERSA